VGGGKVPNEGKNVLEIPKKSHEQRVTERLYIKRKEKKVSWVQYNAKWPERAR